jgi:hypothetical protein
MSKKQRKKISVKVTPGDAVYVAPIETLLHIVETYKYMGSQKELKEDSEFCLNVCEDIAKSIQKTYYPVGEFNEEEW